MNNQRLIDGLKGAIDATGILSAGIVESDVVRAFRTSHRTLQQGFMRVVIIPILRHLADSYKAGSCDGRNMESGRLATRMLENLTDDDLFLPFI